MARLCFVTTCMGRLSHLQTVLPTVVSQPDSSCVVVDYSCPEHCGEWVEATYPHVHVVRVPGRARFNQSAAANAGARAAHAPWMCFFDCDVRFDATFADRVRPLLQPGSSYHPIPTGDGITGTFICARDDFERVGGYDEVYEGWGEHDLDLYRALEFAGVTRRPFPSALVAHIPHDDDLRTRYRNVQSRVLEATVNAIYRLVKFDVMAHTGGPLPLEMRQRLYREAQAMVPSAGPAKGVRTLMVDVRGTPVTFTYRFYPSKAPRIERLAVKGRSLLRRVGFPLDRPDRLEELIRRRRLPLGGRLGPPRDK